MDPLPGAPGTNGNGRPSLRRLIENEKIARAVNERYGDRLREARSEQGEADVDRTAEFFCECADLACDGRIPTRVDVYDEIHAAPDRFIVLPGHEQPRIERVIDSLEGFLVVAKPAA